MNATVLFAALALASPPQEVVATASPGDRLVIANAAGEVVIEGWDRETVDVRSDPDDPRPSLVRDGRTLELVPSRGRRRVSLEARIMVPRWMEVDIDGRSIDVGAVGLDARLHVRTVQGEIHVEDVGEVELRSFQGDVEVERATGPVTVSSQSGDVTVVGAAGRIEAHSGSGDVRLIDIDSESVTAETQDGDVVFSGAIKRGGRYGFFVHSGDATIAMPSSSNASVSVSTFDGDFESEFPVVIERFTGGREFDFVLGDGDASVRIEVFDGEIRLVNR